MENTTAGVINENKLVYIDYFRVVTDINSISISIITINSTADNLQMYLNIFFPLDTCF